MVRRIGSIVRSGVVAGGLLALLMGVGGPAWAGPGGGSPDPGERVLTFDGIASLTLEPLSNSECPNLPAVQADLTGSMTMEVKSDRVQKVREAAIRSLNLAGGGGTPDPNGSFFDVSIMLDPTRDSMWKQPGPIMDSFFDVFFILNLPDPSGNMLMLRSEVPVHLMAMIGSPMPLMGSVPGPSMLETRFESNQPVVFFGPQDPSTGQWPPNPCMELKAMSFVPVNPSAAIIKRELIQIEKKLDRLLKLNEPPVSPPTDN